MPGASARTQIPDAKRLSDRLPPILAEARRVASSVIHGTHGRKRAGTGDDFWQFRPQGEGDGLTDIDWRQSAKSTHLYVRDKEWEVAQTIWLWCDRSDSMRWRGHKSRPDKETSALVMILALADLLLRGGERVGLLGGIANPVIGTHVLEQLAVGLDTAYRNGNASLPPEEVRLKRHTHVVLIGDFLESFYDLENRLKRMAALGVTGHLVQVLDPFEETLPFKGRVEFEGTEGEGRIEFGKVQSVKADYQAAFVRHQEQLVDLTRRLGWSMQIHHTDHPPHLTLLSLSSRLSGLQQYEGGR